MPKTEFEELKRMIGQYRQELSLFALEVREALEGVNGKFDTISTSLKSCQSHCHVANEQGSSS